MGKSDTTAVPFNAVFDALSAIAAVIEESHCFVGADELRALVRSHGRLSRAVGFNPDYRFKDGIAVYAVDGHVVKDPGGNGSAVPGANHTQVDPVDLVVCHG